MDTDTHTAGEWVGASVGVLRTTTVRFITTPGVGEIHTDIGDLIPITDILGDIITEVQKPFADVPATPARTILPAAVLLHQEPVLRARGPGTVNRPDAPRRALRQRVFVPEDPMPDLRWAEQVVRIEKVPVQRPVGLRSRGQERNLRGQGERNKPGQHLPEADRVFHAHLQAETPGEPAAGRLAADQDDNLKEGVPH